MLCYVMLHLVDCSGQPALFSVSSSVECHAGRLSRTTSLSFPFTHVLSFLSRVRRTVSISSENGLSGRFLQKDAEGELRELELS